MPSDCLISGTVYDGENNVKVGALLLVTPISVTGALIHSAKQEVVSEDDGEVSFTVVQGARYNVKGNVLGFTGKGQNLTIPASATADLEDLAAVVSVPTDGLTVKDEGTALSTLVGTFNFVGSGVAVTQPSAGVATVTVGAGGGVWGSITGTLASQTDLQAALDAKAGLTTANTFTNLNTFRRNNILDTYVAGVALTNETAATALAEVQRSPLALWKAAGWDGAASFPHWFSVGINPDGETANLEFLYSTNGTDWDVFAQLQEDGVFTANSIQTDDLRVSAVNFGSGLGIGADVPAKVKLFTTTDTDPVWLVFNGVTALHPAIKRVGTALHFKLANDSAFAAVEALSFTGDGANLTSLSATQLTSGTIPDARFPATLPAVSGVNLTALNASAIASGTLDDARLSANIATKAYADALVVGLIDDRGNFDASGNVFPSSGGSGSAGAVLKGDLWTISVSGTLGGSAVTAGDLVRALVDTPGQTPSNWAVTENNIGYVAENQANKATSFGTLNNVLYPTTQAVASYAQPLAAPLTLISTLGSALQQLRVNAGGTALEYFTVSSSGATTALDNLASVAINTALLTGAGIAAAFTATAPTQITTAQAGIVANLTASAAVAGSSVVGAAAGGAVTITAGNAARLTSGNGNGGAINLVTGTAVGVGTRGTVNIPGGGLVLGDTSGVGTPLADAITIASGSQATVLALNKLWVNAGQSAGIEYDVADGALMVKSPIANINIRGKTAFSAASATKLTPLAMIHAQDDTALTNAVDVVAILGHNTSGTPAAGFGAALKFQGESSTTATQDMAQIAALWTTATHASRTSDLVFSTVNGAAALAEAFRLKGDLSAIFAGIPRFNGTNSTGAGSALLGGNSPATTLTAPYTWISVTAADGSACFVPAWK